MTHPTQQQLIEQEAESLYKDINKHLKRTFIEIYKRGATFALSLNRWVKIEKDCEMPILEDGCTDLTKDAIITDGVSVSIGFYDYAIKQWTSDIQHPTHWQPLPAPPEK
jgi:hypothetical protein